MATNPSVRATLIGQAVATLGGIDVEDVTGPVDVNLLDTGDVEISFGSGWATLTDEAALDVAAAVIRAVGEARLRSVRDADPMVAHARAAVESLGLVWPT